MTRTLTRVLTRREVVGYSLFLVCLGAGWGITQPLSKIAVSEGYRHFGLLFWQMVIGAAIMALICCVRRMPLPLNLRTIRLYTIIAFIGTVLPGSVSFQAAVHLPAGILSLLLSMVPMFAFPVALLLGNDTFSMRRLAGLICGLAGVVLIIAPGVDLGMDLPIGWVLIALITGMFYAFEGNYVARWGTEGLNAFQVLFGASIVGIFVTAPLAVATGQFIDPSLPWHAPDMALVASSIVHVFVYSGYVWLVGRAGPVFAVQVSYLVTGFGLFWAWLILDEHYEGALWLALAAMFAGLYLVQPRAQNPLAVARVIGKDTA